ncbi:MAG: M20/M25/M40 family metallo-hydrolase [Proteobacteria bacterium]|nr:M20/M25/M40 family metallo-hydrolase [Pseudomonadota bacterium]MBI3499060.1 M20/M25/M40 family metallo-hydrolase [Pseudomonadota bacterium]
MTMFLDDRLCRLVADRHQEQIGFLAELVRVPSDNPPGDCRRHGERAAALLAALGLEVERHEVPGELAQAHGMQAATNLIVRHRFGPGPVVALNAHGDVVPPGEGWTADPYGAEIREGWMYGRGVAVSKSDFATYAFALTALIASGMTLAGTVELHFTYDEESGGMIGPKWLLDQGLSRPDFAIAAGFSYQIVVAHNGCLHMEVSVRGKSAHAATPEAGVDALWAATEILGALYGLRESLAAKRSAIAGIRSPSLVVGLIEGGINTNVVPDLVRFRLDRRIIPEEAPVEAERELVALIHERAHAMPGITVEIRRLLEARPLVPSPGQDRLVEPLRRNAEAVFGETIEAGGVPLYTDARHYSAAGIPTVLYGAGPRSIADANAHRADERLSLTDLLRATQVMALTLADLLKA